MGLPFDELWKQVHAANMRKVRAEVPSDSKRGSTFDVVKPPGWVSPEAALYGILKAAGAKL
jgi:predicted HAD superfamily Cof-like phosphohydrolase